MPESASAFAFASNACAISSVTSLRSVPIIMGLSVPPPAARKSLFLNGATALSNAVCS